MSEGITLREFVHKIGFAVSLDGLNAYEKSSQRVDEKIDKMIGGAQKLIGRLESMGKQLSMKLTLPITALAGVSIAARVSQERVQAYWGGLLGGMDKGVEFVRLLKETAEGLPEAFTPEVVDEYARSLKRLQTPVNQIIPMIKKFADIEAGTGQNAGEMMNEYAQAKLNPMMRGRVLQRLMREGVVSEADLRKVGLNPLLMRREGGIDRLSMKPLDLVFNNLALKNMGKAAEQSATLGKNFKNFWESLTKVRESIGAVIEKSLHLNGILKAGSFVIRGLSDFINNLSPAIKDVAVKIGLFLAVLGPGMLLVAQFSKIILGLKMAFGLLNLSMLASPLTLYIIGAIAAAAMLLLIFRQINIEIRQWQGKDAGTVNEGKFIKSGGNMGQWTNPQKGAASDATFSRPVFGVNSAAAYTPRDIFGTGSPVVIHVTNPQVNLPPGTSAQHAAIIQSSHEEIINKALEKAVTQIHNAKRG